MSILDLIQIGDTAAVRDLLARGEVPIADRQAGLAAAVTGDRAEIVKLLLDAGADANNAAPGKQWGAIHLAVEHGLANQVKLLAANGANLNQRDPFGWTPLLLAVDAAADTACKPVARPTSR